MEQEEVESIPWSDLIEEAGPRPDFRRAAYLGAGLLGALVLGVVIARNWWAPSPPTVIAPGVPVASAESVESTVPSEVSSPTTRPLYSEADLMADPPDPSERAAVTRAEWFVTDYFTADHEMTGSADVRAALPGSADLPALPHDGRDGISYVEWARAFAVDRVGDGSYAVSVAFRALAAPPDGAFVRLPVRAVEVVVAVSSDGASVVDLPRPISLPAGPEPEAWPEVEDDLPPEIADRAAARSSVWGTEPRIVSAAVVDGGWRVVVTVADEVGNRWPLALVVAA